VQTLIEAGADKNSADEAGATALYTAGQYGHADVVQHPRELRKALSLRLGVS
jgi:ankyrin repeat protein